PADASRAEASLPTRWGDFRISVFRYDGREVVALTRGELDGPEPVLVRLHSECLTGDVLGSLRCDCGDQLRASLAMLGAAERGVLLYLDHEGRGIGLFDKVRAYGLQDGGLDTVDANVELGLPIDARDYSAAASALQDLGIQKVRLMTNNPAKILGLEMHGIDVVERVPLETIPNEINAPYLRAKASKMGHLLDGLLDPRHVDAANIPAGRPLVTVHYAQTIDGRIASRTGDSRWVSGDGSLRLAHELRAAHDAVLVGIGTVLADDPKLTVRLVPGRSPVRVVVDSRLRIPPEANVLDTSVARTIVATTSFASEERAAAIRARGAEVLRVRADGGGHVDLSDLLARLRDAGIRSVLVEGGRGMITTVLREHLVDRLTVCIAPKVIGEGIAAVGDLHIDRLRDAVTFERAGFTASGGDVIFYGEPAVRT
ncbi:MAG TPA: GTP cyclohydrolase II, partial [Candidatus Limnocylindria bacterium]|nr:GTP cyclohydrolase II [Candidatus Limnocylindria bacterium]